MLAHRTDTKPRIEFVYLREIKMYLTTKMAAMSSRAVFDEAVMEALDLHLPPPLIHITTDYCILSAILRFLTVCFCFQANRSTGTHRQHTA